ncbi:MAG: protein arginine kinase [bacterium]
MSWEEILQRPSSSWLDGRGPEQEVVISSRVRLARNLAQHLFPNRAGERELETIMNEVGTAVDGFPDRNHYYFLPLTKLGPIDRQLLVERHLTSPDHIKEPRQRGIIIRDDEGVSIMVNEEDHLRIQALFSGFQLEEAWKLAGEIDDRLERTLTYAYDDTYGYLTACPTNVGTGLRASVMVHLPGLVMLNRIGKVFAHLSQLGLVTRGLYGEGTEALGNMFQISNQITLGRSEEELLAHLQAITRQVIEQERGARRELYREMGDHLVDRVFRAYGLLTHARLISSKEAINLISDLRLGLDLNLLPQLNYQVLNELLLLCQPAYIQKIAGEQQSARERDAKRAALIRDRLKKYT